MCQYLLIASLLKEQTNKGRKEERIGERMFGIKKGAKKEIKTNKIGIFGLLNDLRLQNKLPSLGFLNPLLYSLGRTNPQVCLFH